MSPSSSSLSSSTSLCTPPDIDMAQADATPTVTLDADEISQDMAARLTIALLGQMLYMKGQLPFPVASLGRMAERRADEGGSRAAQRANKKRAEFLQSYDDLTSHLHTTFVALSTALALNESRHPICTAHASPPAPTRPNANRVRRPAKVHVLLVLGASPSAAKARMLLELDGLVVERFGERDYMDHDGAEESGEGGEDSEEGIEGDAEGSEGSEEGNVDGEDGSIGSADESLVIVPSRHARMPPPRTPPRRRSRSPFTPSSMYSYTSHGSVPSSPRPSDLGSSPSRFSGVSAHGVEAINPLVLAQRAEEAALRAGERLLSRALFAGGEGLGFGDEIPPTQAHILIRAPRRLSHPTWVPRQTLGNMLDRHVQRFLATESCADGKGNVRVKGGFGVGLRTVGVRVQCRGGGGGSDSWEDNHGEKVSGEEEGDSEDDEDEKDEMIWWIWDGKLVGFSD